MTAREATSKGPQSGAGRVAPRPGRSSERPRRLFEREQQLALAYAALDDATSGVGRTLLIQGSAGLGKTALLHEIADACARRSFAVHVAAGDELLSCLSYGVVAELLVPAVRAVPAGTRRALTEGAARVAVDLLQDVSNPAAQEGEASPAVATVGYSCCALVEELAGLRPRALFVDDAHWSDIESLRALAVVGRHLEGLPVLMVVAARTDPPAEVGDVLARLAERTVDLAPLGESAVRALVREAVGHATPDPVVAALFGVTGGNPFLLHELLIALETKGWSGVRWDPASLGRLAPESVRRFALRRLAAAGESAQALARAVAVLGDAPLQLAAELAGVSEPAAVAAADRLAAADLLAPGDRLRFVHPLLRDTVRADIPPAHRALAHANAARLIAHGGAPAEQVAGHLLEALPRGDHWAVEMLVGAAARARDRGAPETATALLTRALAEPPRPEVRSSVAVELGSVQAAMGRGEAIVTLDRAIEWAATPAARANATIAKARALFMVLDTRRAAEMLDDIAADPSPLDPELMLALEGQLVGSARLHPETRGLALARLDQSRTRAFPPRPATVALLANLAVSAAESNAAPDDVATLADAALTGGWLLREHGNEIARVVNALTWVDRLDDALRVLDDVLTLAARTGSLITSTMAYTVRARANLRRGAVLDAEADARIAHRLAIEHGWSQVLAFTAAHLADALVHRGMLEEAGEALASAEDIASAYAVPDYLDSLGQLALARSQPRLALDRFLACGEQLEARGGVDAPGILPWRSHAARALVQLGEAGRAQELATQELRLADASGIAGAIGVATTALGVANGGDLGVEQLEQAVTALERSPRVLSLTDALIEVGSMIRRCGQPRSARGRLARALDLATSHGATALAERARAELLAAGSRPRRTAISGADALTASEHRVATLAASGLTNREIAHQLYVSMRTVGTHLTHVYQKLGAADRDELAAALHHGNIRPP